MPEPTILDLTTRVYIEPLTTAMAAAANAVRSSTSSMASDFAKLGTGSTESIEKIETDIAALRESFGSLAAVVTEAMNQVRTSVKRGAEESALSLGTLKKELGEVVGAAELSAGGAISALGPLGALFGVQMFAHYAEGLKEAVLQTDRLAQVTGVSAGRLAQFRAAMEELGVPTENISRVLLHLVEQMQMAADGSKQQMESFQQLGVSTANWNKQLPDALDVLMRISDHLHEYKGNSDDAAAATHVLGLRMGVELAGGLTVGSKAIQERMDKHKDLHDAVEKAIPDAKRLQQAEAEAADKIQVAVLPFLGLFADSLLTVSTYLQRDVELFTNLKGAAQELGSAFGSVLTPLSGLATAFRAVKEETGELTSKVTGLISHFAIVQRALHALRVATEDDTKGMTSSFDKVLKGLQLLENPLSSVRDIWNGIRSEDKKLSIEPPQKISPGGTHLGKGSNVLEQWKQTLQQQLEDEGKFGEEAIRAEVEFWEKKVAETKKGSAAQLAALRELTRAKRQLQQQENQDLIADDHAITELAATGSAERVRLEQNTYIDIVREGSRQAIEQMRKVLTAQQQFDEEQVKNQIKSVDDQVAATGKGSQQRIDLLKTELAKLQGERDAANSKADAAEQSHDLYRMEVFRSYAEFVGREIEGMQRKFIEAQKQMSEEAARLQIQATIKHDEEGIKGGEEETQRQIREIRELSNLKLITAQQEIQMIRNVETAQHEAAQRALQDELNIIQAKITEVAASGGDTTRFAEQQQSIMEKIIAEKQKFVTQMEALDDQLTNKELQNAEKVASVISSSFQNAFIKMTTTHQNFGKTLQEFWNQMVLGFDKMLAQLLANWLKNITMRAIGEILGQTKITAAVTAGVNAQSAAKAASAVKDDAVAMASAIKSIGRAAAVAAAHAIKWVFEEVPFPANIAVAAGMGAAAFGMVEGFKALASAEKGFDVPFTGAGSIVTALHSREMVLPAGIAENVRRMTSPLSTGVSSLHASAQTSAAALASSLQQNFGGSTVNHNNKAGDVHIHEGAVVVNQAPGEELSLDEVTGKVREAMRRGMLPSP